MIPVFVVHDTAPSDKLTHRDAARVDYGIADLRPPFTQLAKGKRHRLDGSPVRRGAWSTGIGMVREITSQFEANTAPFEELECLRSLVDERRHELLIGATPGDVAHISEDSLARIWNAGGFLQLVTTHPGDPAQ